MGQTFEVTWSDEVAAPPAAVWDAVTRHSDGWLWPISYEPRVGGAETGLTGEGGEVTAWEPGRRFVTTATDAVGTNQLDYTFSETAEGGTAIRYHHHGVVPDDEDLAVQLDACEVHTDLYRHSMGTYATHFAGRDATYVEVDAGPASCAEGSTARLTTALGLDDAAVGDEVTLSITGTDPIAGTVDYVGPTFLGVRSAHGLHRIYGRDRWGWPVSVAHHLFDPAADGAAVEAAWRTFLAGIYETVTETETEETA
ncbi:MAG TPA: SRPBCC domain-containing protein [Iamia sp.]|nr:SRPBCC domain-containing protein [Iamia sp.]